jgi:hypothetical protein
MGSHYAFQSQKGRRPPFQTRGSRQSSTWPAWGLAGAASGLRTKETGIFFWQIFW